MNIFIELCRIISGIYLLGAWQIEDIQHEVAQDARSSLQYDQRGVTGHTIGVYRSVVGLTPLIL